MKMEKSNSVSSLKKQLAAAVAMVCVAAVATSSATYAWFVTNNKVDATTTNISAQSNAAFMTITNGATGAHGVDTTSAVSVLKDADGQPLKNVALYPATFGEETDSTKGTFMTAYGTTLDNGAINSTLETVGTPDEADTKEFAKKEQFNISSKGQNLSDLKVDSVETVTDVADGQLIKTALRVLVTNGKTGSDFAWVVYAYDAAATTTAKQSDPNAADVYSIKLSSETDNSAPVLGSVTAGQDTLVNVYLYYEGSDTNIKTRNLQDNKLTGSQSVKINFTATADNQN